MAKFSGERRLQGLHAAHARVGWFKHRRHVQVDEVTVVDRPMLNKAVGAAALGNAMEWFDFGLYGYLGVTLGQVFFPSSSPTAQLIATFARFAVAFLVRPLGGMVFGALGGYIAGAATVTALHVALSSAQMLDWAGAFRSWWARRWGCWACTCA